MHTVYILRDQKGRIYKGCTNNLERRLVEHRTRQTKTTSGMIGITVIYQEHIDNQAQAYIREKYLKSAAGRKWLKKQNIV